VVTVVTVVVTVVTVVTVVAVKENQSLLLDVSQENKFHFQFSFVSDLMFLKITQFTLLHPSNMMNDNFSGNC
jgi:hypothetical protein